MKTKSFLLFAGICAITTLLTSCMGLFGGRHLTEAQINRFNSIKEKESKLGTISHIFSGSSSRAVGADTNVTIRDDGFKVWYSSGNEFWLEFPLSLFDGRTVTATTQAIEYSSLEETARNYIESHQSSFDKGCFQTLDTFGKWGNMSFDNVNDNYKYVEFITYTDDETGKLLEIEIRIASLENMKKLVNSLTTTGDLGKFVDIISFDPTMKIDLHNHINIETGEYAYWNWQSLFCDF